MAPKTITKAIWAYTEGDARYHCFVHDQAEDLSQLHALCRQTVHWTMAQLPVACAACTSICRACKRVHDEMLKLLEAEPCEN